MRARAKLFRDLRLGDHGAASDAAGQGFGERHDIGLHIPMLVGEPPPGPTHAGLDFIEDEQQIVLVS